MSENGRNICPACTAPLDLRGRCIMGPRLCDHGWAKPDKPTQKMEVVSQEMMRNAMRSDFPPPPTAENDELLTLLAPPPAADVTVEKPRPNIGDLIAESLDAVPPPSVSPVAHPQPDVAARRPPSAGSYPVIRPKPRFPLKVAAFGFGIVVLVAFIILIPSFRVIIERVPAEAMRPSHATPDAARPDGGTP